LEFFQRDPNDFLLGATVDHGRNLVISLTRGQNNNQWSGGIAAHHNTKNSECKNPLEKFPPVSIFWDQDGILLIDYFPKSQTINAEC